MHYTVYCTVSKLNFNKLLGKPRLYCVFYYYQWRSQGGGATGHLPPPLGLLQVFGRECTHQADQGENGNLQ